MIIHATYSAVFLVIRLAMMIKVTPLDLTAVGSGFSQAMVCSATFIYPVITGSIMGKFAAKKDIYNCIY